MLSDLIEPQNEQQFVKKEAKYHIYTNDHINKKDQPMFRYE